VPARAVDGIPHASQGTLSLCGTAIECSLTGVFQIVLAQAVADLAVRSTPTCPIPLIETKDEWWMLGVQPSERSGGNGRAGTERYYDKSSLDSP